jgi:hypothetical protein
VTLQQEAIPFLVANSTVNTRVTLAQARGTVSGDFGFGSPLSEDPIGFAVGGEYREYQASQISDLLASGGDLAGAGGAGSEHSRRVQRLRGLRRAHRAVDCGSPLLPASAARSGRSLFRIFRSTRRAIPSFNTTTYKVGGKWIPVEGFRSGVTMPALSARRTLRSSSPR